MLDQLLGVDFWRKVTVQVDFEKNFPELGQLVENGQSRYVNFFEKRLLRD